MLVLLPPSEGKTPPTSGPPLDLAALSLPGLTTSRGMVLDALTDLCRTDPDRMLGVLGLGPRQAGEVARDAALLEAPTAPAWQVYSGVLFAALGLADADAATRDRLTQSTLVWSGLWGAVGLADPIPAYRLSGTVTLPGPGRLATFWRGPLHQVLDEHVRGQLILDLRSTTYAASWAGPPDRTVSIRVIHEQGSRRTVASHFNKATKGRLLRALATADVDPATAGDVVDALRAVGFRAEPVSPSDQPGRPGKHLVDVVVDHL